MQSISETLSPRIPTGPRWVESLKQDWKRAQPNAKPGENTLAKTLAWPTLATLCIYRHQSPKATSLQEENEAGYNLCKVSIPWSSEKPATKRARKYGTKARRHTYTRSPVRKIPLHSDTERDTTVSEGPYYIIIQLVHPEDAYKER